jgi:2',3'-cyclic-nucleotide 2'-phosphodiesterase
MLAHHLPSLREKYSPDVVIANNENMSHGKGPRMNQIHWLEEQGVDIFTGGNHTLDSVEDIRAYMDAPNSKQLRPDNLTGENIPGTGHREFIFGDKKILVINLIGTAFMGDKCPCTNPFQRVEHILKNTDIDSYEAILVDFHKEATSEGYAMANYLDGRVSLIWGTHTHVQSADAEIWPG